MINLGYKDSKKSRSLSPLNDLNTAFIIQEEGGNIIVGVIHFLGEYLYYCADAVELSSMQKEHSDLQFYQADENLSVEINKLKAPA